MRVSRFVTLAAVLGIAASALAATTAASAAPGAAARPHELFGVSCVSPANCVAVGSIDNGKAGNGLSALADTWNGRSWKTSTMKLPAGAFDVGITGVSCAPAADCFAVGSYATLTGDFALVETWNGKAWTPSTPPSPAGSHAIVLYGVSCATATSCVAIGASIGKTGFAAIAERWNGVTWVPATLPAVRGGGDSQLTSVSCATATRCVAAGSHDTFNGGESVLIESWNGKAWKVVPAANPAGGNDAFLTGVSCPSARRCVAVGVAAGSHPGLTGFGELWNGSTWRVARVTWPRGTGSSFLAGVSCASVARCVAAGHTGFNVNTGEDTGRAAAVSWNGRTWTVTRVPAPGKGKASLFNAVTCLSPADCVAAGHEGPFNTIQGNSLTGFWNGSRWNLVAAP
jgi:hypothetical protein